MREAQYSERVTLKISGQRNLHVSKEFQTFTGSKAQSIPTEKKIFQDGEYKSVWPCVAEKLSSGRPVLFTGLGCDVAALKSYLSAENIDDSDLFTADILCFGPALIDVHKQYIDSLERKYKSRITNFTVRHKAKGWTPPYVLADFENGKRFCTSFYETDYGLAFMSFTREACFHCKFKGANHKADITLGDFWGLTPGMSGYNPDGVSIFIVKTERGESLIHKIDPEEFALSPADVDFVIGNNSMYYASRKKPEDYARFIDDLKTAGLHRAIMNHFGLLRYYTRGIRKMIPRPVKRVIKAILRR